MARRRHYRGLRGLVKFPGLSGLKLPSSVKPVDVVVGLLLGFGGAIALKKGISASGAAVPDIVSSPLAAGAATGLVLFLAQKKKNPARAGGHALGAVLGGAAVWGYNQLAASGALGDLRTLPGGMGRFGGPIFDNPRTPLLNGFGGPIFDNPGVNLGALARMQGLGDENEDGMFPAP